MDWKKIIIAILVIILLLFGGQMIYRSWLSDDKVATDEQEIIALLQKQQGAILTLKTEIAEIEKRVVSDTMKEKVIMEEDKTYEGVKEELIKLRENEAENKKEITELRKFFEKRIDEFQESKDKIMITSGEEKIIIYEDEEGNLVSLNEGVTIIRHRKVEPLLEGKKDLEVGKTIEELNDNWSFSMIYDGGINVGVSYSIVDWKDLSLNVTAYDFEQPKLGADVSYKIKGNLEIGAGIGLLDIKEMDFITDYYVRFGIRIEF